MSVGMDLIADCVVTFVDVPSETAIKGVIDGPVKLHVARSTYRIKTKKVLPEFQPNHRSKFDIATLEGDVIRDASQNSAARGCCPAIR